MKQKILILFFLTCLVTKVFSADTTQSPVRIAVMMPLYLDSAFTGNTYNLSNTKIPQYFLSGLEFYNGVMMAVDSLQKENSNIEVWIYDTHKQGTSVQQLISEMEPLKFAMIIAVFSSLSEQKAVSEFSAKNSIPVLSATYPTDAYLNYNPFFVMLNPTWKTHVDAICNYLIRNYKNQKLVYFTKGGALEDRITAEFRTADSNHFLKFSNIILGDNFSDEDVLKHLDSTRQNVVVCGSLNENFGRALIKTINDNGDAYHATIIGMPTWNGMSGTTGNSSDKTQLVISSPYDYLQSSSLINSISNEYKTAYYAKPSDMVYKGYESMYHFTKVLLRHPGDFINSVSDSTSTLFNNYNVVPIRLTKTSFVPDYLENKKIYFIKLLNGDVEQVQ